MTRAPAVSPARMPSRDELLAERCKRSLYRFVLEAWSVVEPGVPFVDNWHIRVICEHLERVSRGLIRKLIINIPPRAMKSLIVAVFWPCWEWLHRPGGKWLFVTYTGSLTLRDSLRCRTLIQSAGGMDDTVVCQSCAGTGRVLGGDELDGSEPLEVGRLVAGAPCPRCAGMGRVAATLLERVGYRGLVELLGDPWGLNPDQSAKGRFENDRKGYRLATAVHGMATGEGGDRVVLDDPHNAAQAQSEIERGRTTGWYDHTIPTRLNDPNTSSQVVVMQRLHEDDLTGHLLKRGGWHHLCLPGLYDPRHPYLSPADIRTVVDEPLDRVRMPSWRIKELRVDLGAYGFAGQILQLPAPAEGGLLKKAWWRRYFTVPKLQRVLISWDLTFGSGTTDGSFDVGQVWGVDGPNAYLLDEVRERMEFVDILRAVKALKSRWPAAGEILIENKAAGAPTINTLRLEMGGIIAVEPEGSKEERARAVTPYIESGNVYLPEWAIGDPVTRDGEWVGEMAMFPAGSRDDRVDAMSQALYRIYIGGSGAVGTTKYRPGAEGQPTVKDGDITLTGERYVDQDKR